MHGTKNV